jgi:hypothetical protein
MAKRTSKAAGGTSGAKGRAKAAPKKPRSSAAVRAAKAPARTAAGTVYQVKITLDGLRPPVWRRVLVKDCSLAKLHDLIQISMGWDDYHLHVFEIGGEQYGDREQWDQPGPWDDSEVGDERKVKLSQLVAGGIKKFRYVYDMGDNWEHTIQIEKELPAEAGVRYPRCTDGKRACPPEDCGGVWGYGGLLEALGNPRHAQHDELREWSGGEFDPEQFDPEAVNQELAGMR